MRKILLVILLVCGGYQWQLLHADEEIEDGIASVDAAPPGAWERLGLLVGEEAGPEEAPPPRMVHCVIDGEGAFLRTSECQELGGSIDEPSWARSSP